MKLFIFVLLVVSLFIAPFFVSAECAKVGTTVIFINGIFGDKEYAEKDKKGLEYEYGVRGLDNNTTFVLGYNTSHGRGVSDLVEAGVQMYKGGYLDNDLTDILRQVYTDLKTQKIILVGHSQGTFYTNAAYDYLVGHGVDKSAIAIYNVATPADKVSGDGKYLTSSTDKIIDSIARKLATLASAKKPLVANIDIKIPDNPEIDYASGHSFSQAYLGLVPDEIIGGIDQELSALTVNSDKKECFTQPKLDTMYRVFYLGYEFIDNVGEYSQYVQGQIVDIGNVIVQGIYNFGRDFMSNLAQAIGKGTASVSSFLNNNNQNSNPPFTPILSPDLVVTPVQPPIIEEITPPIEPLSYQDQLDDIQEKLDIIKQQVQELIDQQNQTVNDEQEKLEENIEENKDKEPSTKKPEAIHTDYPKILISEVQISPISQRFIELYNPNSTSISLTGWYLQRKDSNDSLWGTLVSSTNFEDKTIPSNGYFLISREIGGSDIFSNITLANDSSLVLKNPNEEISDKLGFGNSIDPEIASTINPVIGQSIGRKIVTDGVEQDTDNNLTDFEASTPTPKAQNVKYVAPPIATLASIAITTPAKKIVYNIGDVLDITGLVVTGTYSDSTTRVETVTSANITGFNSTTAIASQALIITIGDKTVTYAISINTVIDITSPNITTYTISNQVFSPNGDGIKDITSIDLSFSEDVIVDLDIINSAGIKVRDIYNPNYEVKNPDAKIWDGKDNAGILVSEGVYTVKIVITDIAGNSITNIGKKIAVDNFVPSSENFTITPTCLFSSPDVSNELGNVWSVVGMCGCSSPAWSDEIKGYGINMKICGWDSSTNQICNNIEFYGHGYNKIYTYPKIYIINGVCSLNPSLPDPVPSSDTLVISSNYVVSIPQKGVATIINIPYAVTKAELLANLSKNQAGQTWDSSAISEPPVTGDVLVVLAEDGISKAVYTISVPNSNKFTITPDCVFSSPDVSDAHGNVWSVVSMCGCSSPGWSDNTRSSGHDMKICGWGNTDVNQTCYDVAFYGHGYSKIYTYQTIYIINGICSLLPSIAPIDNPIISGIRPPVIGGNTGKRGHRKFRIYCNCFLVTK
jgi:regulator of replication initiation timing